MKKHPLSLLREELAVADATTRLWKKLTMAAVVFALLCLGIAVAVVAVGGAYARELSAYRLRCIDHDSAEIILGVTTTLVNVNDACFELHERNIANLEQNFPAAFGTPEGKRLRYMYEVADVKGKDVPLLPTGKAVGGGVLQGDEQE